MPHYFSTSPLLGSLFGINSRVFLLVLPKPLSIVYRTELETMEDELKVHFRTSIEELAHEEGREEGMVRGIQESVLQAIEIRFKSMPDSL